MTTFEAIKKMTFMEMARFLASFDNDTTSECTCLNSNCPFEPVCVAEGIGKCVHDFSPVFSAAKFLALDYKKTKLEE